MFTLEQLKFFGKQRFVGFEVPSAPHFDSEATTEWYTSKLAASKKYLEYGTGGTTYVAAKLGVPFIAVDSDPYFLKSVKKKIERDGFLRSEVQAFVHADIGLTQAWGHPVREWRASPKRLEKFRRYSDPPRQCFENGLLPDLVLVDGRFRVACALKAVRMLSSTTGWSILVDDYSQRPEYAVIADFAELDQYVGRMAVFSRPRTGSAAQLESAIRQYETVSR